MSDYAIRVSHFTKQFGNHKAVNDISFQVEEGELFGFLGVNGAGKSTTINMLCTLFPPTSGTALIAGYTLGQEDDKIKPEIEVVYQNNCLDELLTVKENLLLRGGLYETDQKKIHARLQEVSELLELEDVLHRRFGKLSGGQKRRCEIARALMNTPKILFLDEPTTGLDPATRKSVWEIIHKLQKEKHMTVFLTTHYMEEAAKAKHIVVIDKGTIVETGTPFSLKEKYAKDKLRLMPKAGVLDELTATLDLMQVNYYRHAKYVSLELDATLEALVIVNRTESLLEGFEVIQGTMDDVFLSLTRNGEENHEKDA